MHTHLNPQQRRSLKRKFLMQDIPLTPMIDVVFQLLIYFVLTFELADRMSQMQVWRPRGDIERTVPPPTTPHTITVHPGFYTFNDTRVSLTTLETSFNRFADLNPEQNVIVVATAASKHQNLVHVLNLLNKAGLENVSLLSLE